MSNKKILANKAKKTSVVPVDFITKSESFFERNKNFFFWLLLVSAVLTGLMIFDLKVSKGGDDAAYIIRAFNLVNGFSFPSFQGPLWPFVLSIPVAIFGIKLSILKFVAFVFCIGQFWFLYKAFAKNIPSTAFYPALFLSAINTYLMYYASQTYSEALFLFLQSVFIYFFIVFFINQNTKSKNIRQLIKPTLIIGLFLFLLGITRSVGYAAVIVVCLYFAYDQNWRAAAMSVGSFFAFSGAFGIVKKILWQQTGVQFSDQLSQLITKDPYYPQEGNEDLLGFAQRFFDNTLIYLSKYFYIYQGFRPDITENSLVLAILTVVILIIAFWVAFKNNKTLFFIGLYTMAMLAVTFVMLQKRWDSWRLIVTNIPLLYVFIFGALVYIFKNYKLQKVQWVLLIFFIVLFSFSFKRTKSKITQQIPIIKENLKGDKFFGFTPDWVNFLSMAEWVGKNIPKEQNVACRKPDMAQIYGNRKFHGIYRMPSENADSLAMMLNDQKIDYIIMGSLRKYEQQKTEYTINTISRYLYFLQTKYKTALSQVHQIGAVEPAYLIKIDRNAFIDALPTDSTNKTINE